MNKIYLLFVFTIILCTSISPLLLQKSFAQENQIVTPRVQWKHLPDPNVLICKDNLILLQKINGSPACVTSSTYLKLIDRGYGKFDSSQLMKRPEMMTSLMHGMINDLQLMNHWHNMMISNPTIMQKIMSNLVLQTKGNLEFMKNVMGPMTTNPELRGQMIEHMKNHNQMMNSLQEHPGWMNSVHQPLTGSKIGNGMNYEMPGDAECSWCPEVYQQNLLSHQGFQQPKIMEDMIHHIWINEKMRNQMHSFMLESPDHMGPMTGQMIEPMLGVMMDDPELRQKMIDLMLKHQDFMNSIRHENKFSN